MKLPEERFAAKIKDIALSHYYSFIKETSKNILACSQSCVGFFFFLFFLSAWKPTPKPTLLPTF